jgi:hypothetical protein
MERRTGMKRILFFILVMAFFSAGQVSAVPIFSTLGPGDSYKLDTGYTIGVNSHFWDQGNGDKRS